MRKTKRVYFTLPSDYAAHFDKLSKSARDDLLLDALKKREGAL